METKNYKKSIKAYKVEFRVYGRTVCQDVHICAYSPKQAKKFFYDWWKNHHLDYAVVVMVSEIENAYARALASATTGETLEERFESQQKYIYGGKRNG